MYEFSRGRAAIVTEIYLPAKYAITPAFLAALDASLSPEKVQEHFRDGTKEAAITTLLHPELARRYRDLRDGVIESRRSFGGYSVYDLKGAWTAAKGIDRDANLCVRFIDWPDPHELFPADEGLCRHVIRTVFGLRLHHMAPNPIESILQQDHVQEICRALDTWIDRGSFLLYGFVMFHLLALTGGLESEVWLTSHFAVVNVYGRQRQEAVVSRRPKCIPEELSLVVGNPERVVVTCENAPAGQVWGAYGYDESVIDVTPRGQSHTKGVATFTVQPRAIGTTTITFGMAVGYTCECRVLVAN